MKNITFNKSLISLLLVYIIAVVLRLYTSSWIGNPYYYPDEFVYSGMARSFFENGTFMYLGDYSRSVPPLYPMLISSAYLSNDMFTTYALIKIINSLLSALIIFPVWLLAKEFLSEREALIPAAIVAVLPGFTYSGMIMLEGMHYTVTIATVYLIYRSLTEDNLKIDILCGAFMGIAYLTKGFGVFMPIVYIAGLLIKPKGSVHERSSAVIRTLINKKWTFAAAALVVLPWFIRNGMLLGFTFRGMIGSYAAVPGYALEMVSGETGIPYRKIVFYLLSNLSYLSLASGIVFFSASILLLLLLSENKLVNSNFEKLRMLLIIGFLSIFIYVIYGVYHGLSVSSPAGYYRVQGRYMDSILPLFIIIGYIGLKYLNDNYDKIMIKSFAEIIILTSLILMFAPFTFVSRMNVVVSPDIMFLAIFKDFTTEYFSALFFVIFPFVFLVLYKYNILNRKYISLIFIIFLLFSGYLAFVNHVMVSRASGSMADIGKWFVSNTTKDDVILVDASSQNISSSMEKDFLFWQTQFWLRDRAIAAKVLKFQRFDFGPPNTSEAHFTLISNVSSANYTWAFENVTAVDTDYPMGLTKDYVAGRGQNQLKIKVPPGNYIGTLYIRSNENKKEPMYLYINGNKTIYNKTILNGHLIQGSLDEVNVTDGMVTIDFDGDWVINALVLASYDKVGLKGDYLATEEKNLNFTRVYNNSENIIYNLR